MKKTRYFIFVTLLAAATSTQAEIVGGQWLQINFTDGFYSNSEGTDWAPAGGGGLRNWNYMTDSQNPSYNVSTDDSTLFDSLGNSVDGVAVSATGWHGGGWSGEPGWLNTPPAGPDGAGGNHLMAKQEVINFWWSNGDGQTITISGLDAELTYNVKLYSLNNGTGNGGETLAVDLNGDKTAFSTEVDRWNATETPYIWTDISATAGGDLVFTFDVDVNENPVINAIVIEAISDEPAPEIGNIAIESLSGTDAIAITWATAIGVDYALENKLGLDVTDWTTNTTISGTGGNISVTTTVDQAQSFYRVIGE